MRRYSTILLPQTSLALYGLGSLAFGLAFFPGAAGLVALWMALEGVSWAWRLLAICLAMPLSFLLYGVLMMAMLGLVRSIFRITIKEGDYGAGAPEAQAWLLFNGLHFLYVKTFLDFLRLSPMLNLYLRWMGAKVGQGCVINTKNIADMPLLEIGDEVMIGGDAVIICHAVYDGKLSLRRTRIGDHATIGLEAVILPGVEVGEDATVAARACVFPGARVARGATWAGSPARAVRNRAASEVVGAPLPDGGAARADRVDGIEQDPGHQERADRMAEGERNGNTGDRVRHDQTNFQEAADPQGG